MLEGSHHALQKPIWVPKALETKIASYWEPIWKGVSNKVKGVQGGLGPFQNVHTCERVLMKPNLPKKWAKTMTFLSPLSSMQKMVHKATS